MGKTQPLLIASHITKRFGRTIAVEDVSLSASAGEIIGILGPNGAGKSTTMRMLAGFLPPDSGTIRIHGREVRIGTYHHQEIGYLAENNPLYPSMLVSEYIWFIAALHAIEYKLAVQRIDQTVRDVGIGSVFYQPIGSLSKGYKQRVGLAGAILHQPDIVLLDEPTEGLDPTQRHELHQLIKQLAKERVVLLSSHVLHEVQSLCNRVLIISQGRVVADGSVQQLAQRTSVFQIEVELEGKDIVKKLQQRKEWTVEILEQHSLQRVTCRLIATKAAELQPHLSSMLSKNRWTVWRLVQPAQNLDEVFAMVTKENI